MAWGINLDETIRRCLSGEFKSHDSSLTSSKLIPLRGRRAEVITLLIDFAMLQGFILELHEHDCDAAADKYTRALDLFIGAEKRWPELFTTAPCSTARCLTMIPHGKLLFTNTRIAFIHLCVSLSVEL